MHLEQQKLNLEQQKLNLEKCKEENIVLKTENESFKKCLEKFAPQLLPKKRKHEECQAEFEKNSF